MSAATPPPVTRVRPPSFRRDDSAYQFSLVQFDRMTDFGILANDDHVELIDGRLFAADDTEYRFSLGQYEQLVKHGILTKDDRVEFLDHLLVKQMPVGPRHAGATHIIGKRVARRLPDGWEARTQLPVRLGDAEPQPDVAVVFGQDETFLARHPVSAEVGLVIEVADSSLARDQRDKALIYAEAGVPAYWIINLIDGRVEAYSRPGVIDGVPGYAAATMYVRGETVPLTLAGQVVAAVPVAEMLVDPPAEARG